MTEQLRVVVIDDDPDTRANLEDILQLEHCVVKSVGSLREALTLDNWSKVNVVILDRRLADDVADKLLGTFRRLAPQAAIIVITAYADLNSTIAALRHGVYDYILKPINPEALLASLSRLRQLHEARRQALQAQRLAAIGQTVAGLTHESRNALQRIQSSVEMLRFKLADQTAAIELCDRIEQAVSELLRLHEQVRSYAAPVILERRETDLRTIWRHAWQELAHRHREKRLRLVEQTEGSEFPCEVDPFAITQVFRNLFDNAIDASPVEGQVHVLCRACSLHSLPAWAITVRDDGPGIDPAQFEKLFQPFVTTKPKGTGLGLAIAQRLVDAHGGKLIASRLSRGAEFTIYLPRTTVPSVPSEAHYFVLDGLPFT